jgi:uroporphyrinogen decarboxylase
MRLDALESLQPEAMDVYELKRKTAGRMVLIGGLGTQQMLPFGTPEKVGAETRRLMRELGAGGGYVLSPAKPLMADVPTANALAFIRAAVEQ